jgi:hypothetical protein
MFDPALIKISLFDLIDIRNLYDRDISLSDRIVHAVDWIAQAYLAPGHDGTSRGYDLLRGRWLPPRPETSTEIIATLLDEWDGVGLGCGSKKFS